MATLGKLNTLRVTRHSMPGYYLDGGELGEVLLPKREVPSGTKMGDKLYVFVYRDADGRLLATMTKPMAQVGEVAALREVSLDLLRGQYSEGAGCAGEERRTGGGGPV